jgi:hypothetical protein
MTTVTSPELLTPAGCMTHRDSNKQFVDEAVSCRDGRVTVNVKNTFRPATRY